MIGTVREVTELREFGENLRCKLEFDPIEGKLQVTAYHADHFRERIEVVIEENGNRELTLTGASDGFKDKLGEELEFDGASDTGNGERHNLVSVFHSDDTRSLHGHFFR